MNEDAIQAILRERTRALARPAEAPKRTDAFTVLVCGIGEARFGLRLEDVARVIPFAKPAFIPSVEPALMGALPRAGRFYRVYDLAVLLGGRAGVGGDPGGYVLLLREGAIALRVDSVFDASEVEPLSPEQSSHLSASHAAIVAFAREVEAGEGADRTISIINPRLLRPRVSHAADLGD